jgi:hypothetical protein
LPFDRLRASGDILKSFDTFDGAKPQFLNRGKKRRSVSTLSIPRASGRGVEWVDFSALPAGTGETGDLFMYQASASLILGMSFLP